MGPRSGVEWFLGGFKASVVARARAGHRAGGGDCANDRSSLLEVLREDYVRTAKSKGLSFYRVVFVHALKNALLPVVTVIGLMLGTALTGAVLTETLFSWPGVGRWLVASVQARDYPVLQGGVLLLSVMIVVVNLAVDLLYLYLNPRLRSAS